MIQIRRTRSAFTLIELLTVIAIITLLIGILTPALGRARDEAKKATIKAQLNSIGTGNEMFQNDQNRYAPSNAGEYGDMTAWEVANGGVPLQGANLLVDAMVGRDFLGYDSKPTGNINGVAYDRWNPLNQRRTRYIDPAGIASSNKSTAVRFGFADGPSPVADNDQFTPTFQGQYCPVFLDKFEFPILYYCANRNATQRSPILPKQLPDNTTLLPRDNPVFNGFDNRFFTAYNPTGGPQGQKHEIDGADDIINGDDDFSNNFLNYIHSDRASTKASAAPFNITFARPHNAEKFLLISAGKDGIYGTLDDVKNFE